MRALRLVAPGRPVELHDVPVPSLGPRDVLVRVRAAGICHSDAHYRAGRSPARPLPLVLGHEVAGEVERVGERVTLVRPGDRVCLHYLIACADCYHCSRSSEQFCRTGSMIGHFRDGGWAEYIAVPERNAVRLPDEIPFEHGAVAMCSSATSLHALRKGRITGGDTVAVFGCGPVGQFAIRSAFILGAGRVIAIDTVPERRRLAERAGAETLDSEDPDVFYKLREMTGGLGPDACIDAVGLEAHGPHLDYYYDKAKTMAFMATDRASALRQAIFACRKGGTVSVPGVYGGFVDKVPFGAVVQKALTIKSGQTHVHKYLRTLLGYIEDGQIDPSEIITHRASLDDAPELYKTFRDKKDGCIKVVLKPAA